MPNDTRLEALNTWLADQLGAIRALQPASTDASFRRYFRAFTADGGSYVVMDAPPQQEPLAPFLDIGRRLAGAGVHVPLVHVYDIGQGFALLDDLGSTHYLEVLGPDTADTLYGDAFHSLLRIQQTSCAALPVYDRLMLERETALFPEWFLGRHFGLKLDGSQRAELRAVDRALSAVAGEQPQVFVHRDYHSRNLMRTERNNPGVLDFQGAVRGPLTYDLVSLLRDVYVAWPEPRVRTWALDYRDRIVAAGLCERVADADFLRWFDFMGLQRQIKILGLFARLYRRDGKAGYLGDLPRTLAYILQVAPRYAESAPLAGLLHELEIPALLDRRLPACAP